MAGSNNLWKRLAWALVVAALIGSLAGIYAYLRPAPPVLAEPVELALEAGKRYQVDHLPLGGRYRLRACDHATEIRVGVGRWNTGWIRLPVNPMDLPSRDIRIDGRAGGTLVLEARTPTGRLLLMNEHAASTCRGDEPTDLAYPARRVSRGWPPFDCEEETLSRYDREALEWLRAELLARFGAPKGTVPLVDRFTRKRWYHKVNDFSSKALPEEALNCLERIEKLVPQAPEPGSLPFVQPLEVPERDSAPTAW